MAQPWLRCGWWGCWPSMEAAGAYTCSRGVAAARAREIILTSVYLSVNQSSCWKPAPSLLRLQTVHGQAAFVCLLLYLSALWGILHTQKEDKRWSSSNDNCDRGSVRSQNTNIFHPLWTCSHYPIHKPVIAQITKKYSLAFSKSKGLSFGECGAYL